MSPTQPSVLPARRPAMPVLMALALLLAALAPVSASAQVVRLEGTDGGSATTINPYGPQYGFRDPADADLFVWVFLDGVEVLQEGRRLRGQTLVAVIDRSGPDPAAADPNAAGSGVAAPGGSLKELYLEGDVTVEEAGERTIGATSVYYDDTSGRMIILEGELRLSLDEPVRTGSVIVRFEQMRRLSANESVLDGVTYSNCEFEHRHWYVRTDRVVLRETNHGTLLTTGDNYAYIGDVPVMWWPGLRLNLDGNRIPLRKVELGSSSRYGTEMRTLWGGEADDIAASVVDLFGYDGSRARGEWELDVTFMSDRGVFIQPLFRYETDHSEGTLFFAFINDTGDEDQLDKEIPQNKRGRIDLEHRTRIDEHRTLDIELSDISDDQFLDEYYEGEFRTGKEQETYLNYRDVVDNRAMQFLFRVRLNDFQTQVEYLPQIEQLIIGESIGDVLGTPTFLTARGFISNGRLRYDDDESGVSDARVVRTGGNARLDMPIDVGDDRVVLSTFADIVHFSDSVNGGGTVRTAAAAQGTWSRTYSGVDASRQDDFWNIDGMRRIVEPMIGYESVFALNNGPDELIPIDSIETLKRFQEFFIGVRDRIQTHQDGQVVTILDTEIRIPLYFNPDRDNDPDGDGDGEVEGNVMFDSVWTPGADTAWLRNANVRWRGEYDPNKNRFEESFMRYMVQVDPERSFMIANNKAHDSFNFLTIGTQWVLTPKWLFALFYQQDLMDDEEDEHAFVLRKVAHRWYIDLKLEFERGESSTGGNEDEVAVSISLSPAMGIDPRDTLLDSISHRTR